METEFELIAKTFQGLENVLAKELTDLGANNIQTGRRMVSFTGVLIFLLRGLFSPRLLLLCFSLLSCAPLTFCDCVIKT